MKVRVLTREINLYDQDGEYFVAVFDGLPHHSQLTACGVPQNRLRHVLNGGGRVEYEDEWFHLREVECPRAQSTPQPADVRADQPLSES